MSLVMRDWRMKRWLRHELACPSGLDGEGKGGQLRYGRTLDFGPLRQCHIRQHGRRSGVSGELS